MDKEKEFEEFKNELNELKKYIKCMKKNIAEINRRLFALECGGKKLYGPPPKRENFPPPGTTYKTTMISDPDLIEDIKRGYKKQNSCGLSPESIELKDKLHETIKEMQKQELIDKKYIPPINVTIIK